MSLHCPIINIASSEFLQQLDAIEAGVWGTPCSVTLEDGTSHDICLACENKCYSDAGAWLNPNRVVELRECQSRLPAKFARILFDAEESGMGYHIYIVELADGTEFVHMTGNLTIDLLNLPIGYSPKDVTKVIPHQGCDRHYRRVAEYSSLEYARTT